MIAALLIAAAAPSAEAEALGRRLAATSGFGVVLPAVAAKETDEIVAAHPELAPPDRDRLRATARRVASEGFARINAALGHEYALALPIADLRALVAFNDSPVAARYRAAVPGVLIRGMAAIGPLDFKKDVAKAFCAETGKLCE